MNRRTFIKIIVAQQLYIAISKFLKARNHVEILDKVSSSGGYGAGKYGSGTYPGQMLYLPIIAGKEGSNGTASNTGK